MPPNFKPLYLILNIFFILIPTIFEILEMSLLMFIRYIVFNYCHTMCKSIKILMTFCMLVIAVRFCCAHSRRSLSHSQGFV